MNACCAFVCQDFLGVAFDAGDHARHDVGRARLRHRQPGGHAGIDVARIDADDQRALCAQFETHCLGQRPFGGLRCTVGPLDRDIEPARDRKNIDQRAAAIALENRRKRPAHGQRAEVVRFHFATCILHRRCAECSSKPSNASVVDQDRHVAAARRGGGDLVFFSDVELNGFDPLINRDAFDVPGARIDLRAARVAQRAHQGLPQAAIGAGDEGR